MDARCPECENVAQVNDEQTKVTCPHCKFEASYDEYKKSVVDELNNFVETYMSNDKNAIEALKIAREFKNDYDIDGKPKAKA